MRTKCYLSLCLVAMALVGCSQDEEMFNEQNQGATATLTATMEGQGSRTVVDNQGKFTWTTGDAISVWNGTSFTKFNYVSGSNFTAENNQAITPTAYAVYPAGTHAIEDGTLKVNLPGVYGDFNTEYKENTYAPMLAKIDPNNPTNLSFKHLGGLMCFVVKNVPPGTSCFKVEMGGNGAINGNFTVKKDNNDVKYIERWTTQENHYRKQVYIYFKPLTEAKDMRFYVPLPVANYQGGYDVMIADPQRDFENNSYDPGSTWSATYLGTIEANRPQNEIKRGTLLLMPTFTYVEDQGSHKLEKASSNEISLGTNEEATINVSGNNEEISVNTGDNVTGAELDLKYTPTENNSKLSISDGSADNATPTDSKATVNVDVNVGAGTTTVGTLNIDAPTLTVNLASGTYTSVTAKTANNTLVIKAGVTVTTLKLNGGNVIIEQGATVGSIENAEYYSANTYILNKGTLTNTPNLTNVVFVSSESEMNLRTVAENGGDYQLTEDVTLEYPLVVSNTVTLDLNGKTLSGTANRLIRIANESAVADFKVTIKNGTITNGLSGGRCVETRSGNIDLTLDGVKLETTGGGNPQNFTVGGSGNNVTVLIKNSIIKGARAAYGIITFNPVEMTIENSTVEAYAAIYAKPADGSLGSAGSCFDVKNSTLIGKNVETSHQENSFGTVVLEADSITVNVDAQSTLKAATVNPNVHAIFRFNASVSGTRITVDTANMELSGNESYTFVPHDGMGTDNVLLFPASWKDQLESEGFETVSENGYVKITAIH